MFDINGGKAIVEGLVTEEEFRALANAGFSIDTTTPDLLLTAEQKERGLFYVHVATYFSVFDLISRRKP